MCWRCTELKVMAMKRDGGSFGVQKKTSSGNKCEAAQVYVTLVVQLAQVWCVLTISVPKFRPNARNIGHAILECFQESKDFNPVK